MLTLRAHAAAGRVGNDLRRRHHPQPLWARAAPEKFVERPFKGIPAVCRRVEYESQCLTAAGVAESSRAGSGWAALAVQQAHNERSGRAGRARGVGTGGGMRTREGVGAARQGGRCTCKRAQSYWHPAPDALACLRPTMDGCRGREARSRKSHKKSADLLGGNREFFESRVR